MTKEFIEDGIWPRLTSAARACRGPAAVAVAYFSKGAAALLPLPAGSRLVVDASVATVKAGSTCPKELLLLQRRRRVRVFSVQNLHAKVYVFGRLAFVGSANASRNSMNLKEAIVQISGPAAAAARAFVDRLCLQELGPEALTKLQTLYREPKYLGGADGRRKSSDAPRAVVGALRLVNLERMDFSKEAESARGEGRRIANRKRKQHATHELDDFSWPRRSFRNGESVVQVTTEEDGTVMVSAPGQVLHTKAWSNGNARKEFVFVEVPRRNRISLQRLVKRLGRGSMRRLRRSGRVNPEFAERLQRAWR